MSLVTLVRPPTIVPKWAHTTPVCPPIGVAYVASAVREAGYRVAVVDAVGEAVLETREVDGRPGFLARGLSIEELVRRVDQETAYIGLSCMFSHEWPVARKVINALREALPNAAIIAGGEHITAIPEFSLQDCPALDYCTIGEGEETIVDLVASLDAGRPIAAVPGIVYREGGEAVRTATRGRIRRLNDIAPFRCLQAAVVRTSVRSAQIPPCGPRDGLRAIRRYCSTRCSVTLSSIRSRTLISTT